MGEEVRAVDIAYACAVIDKEYPHQMDDGSRGIVLVGLGCERLVVCSKQRLNRHAAGSREE